MLEPNGRFSKQQFQILEEGNPILQGVFYMKPLFLNSHPSKKYCDSAKVSGIQDNL